MFASCLALAVLVHGAMAATIQATNLTSSSANLTRAAEVIAVFQSGQSRLDLLTFTNLDSSIYILYRSQNLKGFL